MTRRGVGARAEGVPATSLAGVRGLALAAHRLDRCRTIDEVAQVAAATAVDVLLADRVAFCRIEQGTCRTLTLDPPPQNPREVWFAQETYRADERPALRGLIRDRASWLAHAMDVQGEATSPGDADAGDAVEVALLRERGQASAMASPVVVNGTVWGQVYAVRNRELGLFEVDDVARAEVLAALAAGAVARVDLEEQIRHLVDDDPLTGLANRRAADAAVDAALESGRETCVVMCDVDGLKRVNDELGHDTGDDLLRSVADVLRRAADALPEAVAARIGGDEFCLVTVGSRRSEVAEVMAATTAAYPLAHGAAISYGLASTAVTGAVSARHLFRQADVAQYRAKRARARALRATPVTADPAVTAERVVVAASAAIGAAQSGVVPRLCALAAAATETLGGAGWAVLRRREGAGPDDPGTAVARGGSPGEAGSTPLTMTVQHGPWLVEVGVSQTAATGEAVRTALDALVSVAVVGAS